MQQVITESDARKITGGRKPFEIVEYEEACKQLSACLTIDEAKYFSSKADALKAWATIHHDKKEQRLSRALKLWAHRRMGELAEELRPAGYKVSGYGHRDGPASLLMECGLTRSESSAARRLARAKKEDVERLAALPRPPAPGSLTNTRYKHALRATEYFGANRSSSLGTHPDWSPCWSKVCGAISLISTISVSPAELARSVDSATVDRVRTRIAILIDWLDEFERHLPKSD